MPAADSDLAFATEMLTPLGKITTKRMFSGAAVYCNGTVFALYLRGSLYLKADPAHAGYFEAEGCGPFGYASKQGSRVLMSYWQAPERLYDDPDEFRVWARRAIAASIAAGGRKQKRSRKAKAKVKAKAKAAPVRAPAAKANR